ncbi:MAG: 23S rRNA (uracil(1939)-C(5))-methyltransferase RlmD [Candidatus Eremiobacteraeota bacterium]|nr:23S rRNA (uracil(1939)-C(5))-methyltransferase RlmD [Candidatus Eremiobacteraeota bacterium]
MTSSGTAGAAVAPALAPGDIVEIVCTDLIAKTGQAVGRAGGMVVYVLGPVPPERARVRIETVKAKYAVADLVELLDRSPDRVEPFCGVFGTCGGCQVQHLAYGAQLHWKRGIVDNALRRLGRIEDAHVALPVGMDDPRAYRNKMALVVTKLQSAGTPAAPGGSVTPAAPGGSVTPAALGGSVAHAAPAQTVLGFYAARTHDIVPIETCPIVMPQLDRAIAGLWDAARDPATARAFDGARHVIARAGRSSGEGVVSITTERPSLGLKAVASKLAEKLPGTVGISNSFEPPSDNAVMGRKNSTLFGKAEMHEEIDGVRFRVSPASFFQVNSEMVGKIFAHLAPQVRTVERIIDLYCGAGTFTLFFAKHGARVVGIEENPHAVREARANAVLNGLEAKTTFVNGRVDAMLRAKAGSDALAAADVVFLDPPRKGSDEMTLDTLVRARVPHVWYLSCNPATLARDLAQLVAGGYRVGAVQPFDMFPQTGHIEALAAVHRADLAPLIPIVEG